MTVGQSVTFSVTANGTAPFTYQWFKNGSAISGAVAATYHIGTVTVADAGTYSAVVSNPAGSTTSDQAVLSVALQLVGPSITSQPAAQSVIAGQSASFTVGATGSGTLSYQWKKSGANISGATASIYTIATTTSSDAGSYSVVVSNGVGSVTSSAATLTVNPAPLPPSITTQPTSQAATAGQTASFSVVATGSGTLIYQWKKNGTVLSGGTSATLTLSNVTSTDAGSYSAVVTNLAGSVTSVAANLTVSAAPVPPSITTQPKAQSATVGQSVSFSVAATGTGPLSYQWKKNGWDLGVASAAVATLGNVTNADAGLYSVLVANSVGMVSSIEVNLTVNAAPVAPTITTQPTGQSVTVGESASFSVGATGSGPLAYQWKKNGVNLPGATSAIFTIGSTVNVDTGNYSVVVTNAVGLATSGSVSLTVNAAPVAPSITLQPAAQSVTAGASVSFSVSAAGSGTLSYQWKKNSAPIPNATSATFTIGTVSSDDAAGYSVVVSNAVGSVTSVIVSLSVSAAPVAPSITVQPVWRIVNEGSSVSFTVQATGSGPLNYQWKKTTILISGANSSTLTIPNVTMADAGLYTVTVSNGVGSASSTPALLTVSAAPPTSGGVVPNPIPPVAPAPGPVPPFVSQYSAADMGSVTSTGATRYDSATQRFTLTAAGGGIGGTADGFYFASATFSGNFAIVTKLSSFAASKSDSVVGIMIRESGSLDASSASMVVTSAGTVKLIRRLSTGTFAQVKAGRSLSLPVYLRLTRVNGVVTGDYSSNGVDWSTLGSAEMNMADLVRAGLVSTSKSQSATSVAEMTAPIVTTNLQPTVVNGFQLFDVGASGASAAASSSSTTISLSGLGQVFSGATREALAFLARRPTVECAVTANVLPAHLGIPPARAGVMMRETLLDNAPEAILALNAHGQVVFEYRVSQGSFTLTKTLNESARHLMLDRRGNTVTAMVSIDGITWRTIGTATVNFHQNPWVGVATSSSWWTTAVTSDFDSLDVISH